MDFLLVSASNYFPFDYFFFFLLIFYIFVTSLYGLIKLGIKFLCFTVNSQFFAVFFFLKFLSFPSKDLWNQERRHHASSAIDPCFPHEPHNSRTFQSDHESHSPVHNVRFPKVSIQRKKRILFFKWNLGEFRIKLPFKQRFYHFKQVFLIKYQ